MDLPKTTPLDPQESAPDLRGGEKEVQDRKS